MYFELMILSRSLINLLTIGFWRRAYSKNLLNSKK